MGERQYNEVVAAAAATFTVCAVQRGLLQKRFSLTPDYVPYHTWGLKPPT